MKEGRKESKREANTNCLSLSPPPPQKKKVNYVFHVKSYTVQP